MTTTPELDTIPDHDVAFIPRGFEPKDIIEVRSQENIAIDSIGAEAMQYVQSVMLAKGELSADLAWEYAKDTYDDLQVNKMIPVIDGEFISQHMYQVYFMLAFEIESIASLLQSNIENFDLKEFMRDANDVALNELGHPDDYGTAA